MIAADHAFAERILSLIPINSLDVRLQGQALAQGELLEFRKKKTVFEMGARDPYTFYLLDGELELQASESSPVRMSAGDENARRALAQLQPRRYTAVAVTPVSVFRIERAVLEHILADEQVLDESGAEMDVRELEDDDSDEDDSDWMSRLLGSELFTRLPHENIQRFFTELVPLEAAKDEVVVEQGTPGDFLYIVAEGRCAVVRRAPGGGQETQLAILKEGDTFGEEALISNSPRNASVRMVNDGMLMRLPKAAFEELVSNPTLKALPWSEANKLASEGALWVDVRFADEHQADGIEGSINAPLNSLRQQATTFDHDARYIVYCDSGARSSTGAFLMARMGFDTCYLAGGLERSPSSAKTTAAPAAEPLSSEADDIAAAVGSAFEFEFTTGDEDKPADTSEDDTDTQQAAATSPAASDESAPAEAPAASAPPLAAEPDKAAEAAVPAPAVEASAATQAASTTTQHPQMAKARVALASLKLERDKAAAYGKKAADAARELKRRNEELNKVLQTERERREQLDQELAAVKADTQRQASMEQARLGSELEKALKRIEGLQAEVQQTQQQAAAELTQVRAQVDERESQVTAALKEKQDTEAMHIAAEVAFQDSLQSAQSEAKAAQGAVDKIEKELAQARERIATFEAQEREQADLLLSETSRIKLSMTTDQIRVEAERERLEQEREQLNAELEKMRAERDAADARAQEERAALDKQVAAARARDEALTEREIALSDTSSAAQQEAEQQTKLLSEREAQLREREQALSEEKALWQQTVDTAIGDERARLQSELARLREETEAQSKQRVQDLLGEKTQELLAEHQAREAQMRGQVEAHVAKLLAEFDTRLENVRNGYETRLNEQEAMLEDERRRLEAEIVRLREALTDVRPGSPATAQPPVLDSDIPLPAPQATEAPALDFQLNETAAASIHSEESVESPAAASAEPDLTLDLEIDEEELKADAPTEVPSLTAEVVSVPVLEMPAADEPQAADEGRPSEKRDRVISSDQLADIRARMQEKMRAAKSKVG